MPDTKLTNFAPMQRQIARLTKERDELREALQPFVDTYSAVDVVHGLNKSARAKLQRAQKALANAAKGTEI